jgi:hypothetical protein
MQMQKLRSYSGLYHAATANVPCFRKDQAVLSLSHEEVPPSEEQRVVLKSNFLILASSPYSRCSTLWWSNAQKGLKVDNVDMLTPNRMCSFFSW